MEMMNSVSFQFCKFEVLCERIVDHKISYYGVGWAIIFHVHFFCFFVFFWNANPCSSIPQPYCRVLFQVTCSQSLTQWIID